MTSGFVAVMADIELRTPASLAGLGMTQHWRDEPVAAAAQARDVSRTPGIIAQHVAKQLDSLHERLRAHDERPDLLHQPVESRYVGRCPYEGEQQIAG